jgi:hypothetical protein
VNKQMFKLVFLIFLSKLGFSENVLPEVTAVEKQTPKYEVSSLFASEFAKKSLAGTQSILGFNVSELKNFSFGVLAKHIYKPKESIFGFEIDGSAKIGSAYTLLGTVGVNTSNSIVEEQSVSVDNHFNVYEKLNVMLGYDFAKYSASMMHNISPGVGFPINETFDLRSRYHLSFMNDLPKSPLSHTLDTGLGIKITSESKVITSIIRSQDTYIKDNKPTKAIYGTTKIGAGINTWWANKSFQTVLKASLGLKDDLTLNGKISFGINIPVG